MTGWLKLSCLIIFVCFIFIPGHSVRKLMDDLTLIYKSRTLRVESGYHQLVTKQGFIVILLLFPWFLAGIKSPTAFEIMGELATADSW